MTSWPRRPLAFACGLLIAVAAPADASSPAPSDTASGPTAGPASGAAPGTVLTSEGVEVTTYGAVRFRGGQRQGGPELTVAVHGVQRVDGGTVVYLSLGYEGTEPPGPADWSEIVARQEGARFNGGAGLGSVRVVDRDADEVLSTLVEAGDGVAAGPLATRNAELPTEPGTMYAAYAVVPELAEGTTSVDVAVGYGHVVPDVPVGDGALEPTAPLGSPVALGVAWPEVDLAAVADAPEPELSRHPLTRVSQDLEGETTTTEGADSVTVDVAADVLFAFDSAELSPSARATLEEVGADVVERAAGGTLQVVGHTDSEGSDAYNDDLSRRRAQAAAQVLAPYAEQAGLDVVVEGRGEREPVASNDTDEGRQANRRVSVTFDVAEEGR